MSASNAEPSSVVGGWAPRIRTHGFLLVCVGFALAKLAIQVVGNILSERAGYGIFRDEMYYLVCGRHLSFGYVDQPPLVAVQARLTEMLFGFDHMWSLRLISALAGAGTVFLAGVLTGALGGGKRAASLAMLGVIVCGVYLGLDGFLSMNSFGPVFWMLCVLALLRIVQAERARPRLQNAIRNWWIVFGLSAGLGLENKDNIGFFLIAALAALLIAPGRRVLWSRWCAVGVAILLALFMPNLLWQVHHHFPTLELLEDIQHSGKNVVLSPGKFILSQIVMLDPFTLPLWLAGLLWFWIARAGRPYRFLGVLYALYLPSMILLHAKDYYLAPIYVVYSAAGAVGLLAWARRVVWRRTLIGVYAGVLGAAFLVNAPFSIPVLPPRVFLAYERWTGFTPENTENHAAPALPQFYADRFGWHAMVKKVAAVYDALPLKERAVTGIFAGDYGEASAINLFGPRYGLPAAISGHQNYWLWGPRGYTGREMILIWPWKTLADLQPHFASCVIAARLDAQWSMPYEQGPVFLCKGRKQTYASDWGAMKFYH